jgi:hypothetical protein
MPTKGARDPHCMREHALGEQTGNKMSETETHQQQNAQ